MAGQNLLDQGRPGTGHSDDEDRRRRCPAGAAPAIEHLRGQEPARLPDVAADRFAHWESVDRLELVSAAVLSEGLLVGAGVLERLAQGEMELDPRLGGEVRPGEER